MRRHRGRAHLAGAARRRLRQRGDAQAMARRCNDYAADLAARWPRRFGAFATVPMCDDARRARRDRLRARRAEVRRRLAVRELRREFPRRSALRSGDGDARTRATRWCSCIPACIPRARGSRCRGRRFMMEYLFDTTRAVVNLIFSGAIERFPRVQFILPHAGGLVPYFAWRLSVSPMIDKRLPQLSREQVDAGAAALLVRQRALAGRADLRLARSRGAPERIVFGTDYPFANPRVIAEAVEDARVRISRRCAPRRDRSRQCARAVSEIRVIHLPRTRCAPSPACGGGLGRGQARCERSKHDDRVGVPPPGELRSPTSPASGRGEPATPA